MRAAHRELLLLLRACLGMGCVALLLHLNLATLGELGSDIVLANGIAQLSEHLSRSNLEAIMAYAITLGAGVATYTVAAYAHGSIPGSLRFLFIAGAGGVLLYTTNSSS